ncbi:MAG TPA: cytochrome c oxidase subunit II [Spirochaetia bacterium]|nr:cytochrome c oxidase subunit II [Spirochaetia bacterium]
MFTSTTQAVDSSFIVIIALCILVFVGIMFFTVFFLIRYRRSRNPKPADLRGNALLEVVWIAVSTMLALLIFWWGLGSFKYLKAVPSDSIRIHVTASQWSWLFTYGNGRKSTDMVVPQGKDIALDMETKDVIHGFFIPTYRVKQDIVPGMTNHLWFRADTLGTADVLCTQYCGGEHSKMLATVYVVAPDIYQKWVDGEDVDIPGLTS